MGAALAAALVVSGIPVHADEIAPEAAAAYEEISAAEPESVAAAAPAEEPVSIASPAKEPVSIASPPEEPESASPAAPAEEPAAPKDPDSQAASPENETNSEPAEDGAGTDSPASSADGNGGEADGQVTENTESSPAAEQPAVQHQTIPVWHPEWLGRGAEFSIPAFELINARLARLKFTTAYVVDDKESEDASARVALLKKGAVVRLIRDDRDGWCYVEARDKDQNIIRGYIEEKCLKIGTISREDPEKVILLKHDNAAWFDIYETTYAELNGESITTPERKALIDYALQFLGNPYVWGGESLENGSDCSGFVRSVFAANGIALPRLSYEQCDTGEHYPVEEAQPGDLIFYAENGNGKVYHVVICLSNDGEGNITTIENCDGLGVIVANIIRPAACWAASYLPRVETEEAEEEIVEIDLMPVGGMGTLDVLM